MKTEKDGAECYWNDGYVVFRGMFDRTSIRAGIEDVANLTQGGGHRDPLNLRYESRKTVDGGLTVDRIDPVIDIAPALRQLATSPLLGHLLASIFDSPISLLKSKVIIKRPGTVGYMAHQDFLYWRWLDVAPDKLCSVVVSLSDTVPQSGGLTFYEGLHHRLIDAHEHNPSGDIDPERLTHARSEMPVLQQGDVVIFHSLTPHESAANVSCSDRTILISSYAAVADSKLYKKYYDREIIRRLESYKSGAGRESLEIFARAQEEMDSQLLCTK